VFNKLQIFEFPDELKEIRRLERVLIARRIIFKKVTIMPKGQSPKLKGALCNVPVNYNDMTSILPRQADSNGIVLVKLKRKLEYRGHMYFESVRPGFIYRVLQHLIARNHLYRDIEVNTDNIPSNLVNLNIEETTDCNLDLLNTLSNNVNKPISVLVVKASSDNNRPNNASNNDGIDINELETTENPLDIYRLPADETTLMSHNPTTEDIENEILNLAPGEGVNPISVLNDDYCEELAHPHLFPTGQFGYKVDREIPLTPTKYFNQRLLNYTQKFASDSDYIFFANSVTQQLHLSSQINIAMKKVSGSDSLTAGMLSQNVYSISPVSIHLQSELMSTNDLPPQFSQPKKKRSPLIWIIPLVLVLLVAPVVCCGGAIFFGVGMFKAPIEAGVAALNEDPEITEKLGSPIEAGSSIQLSNYENNNGNGGAELGYNVSGPKGSATVSGKMKLNSGTWTPDGLTVTFEDGTTKTLN